MLHFEITGLPITEDRARELAREIAHGLDAARDGDVRDALAELLLGIAPAFASPSMAETERGFVEDQQTRQFALTAAIETLFEFTPEFREAVVRYARMFGREGREAR